MVYKFYLDISIGAQVMFPLYPFIFKVNFQLYILFNHTSSNVKIFLPFYDHFTCLTNIFFLASSKRKLSK